MTARAKSRKARKKKGTRRRSTSRKTRKPRPTKRSRKKARAKSPGKSRKKKAARKKAGARKTKAARKKKAAPKRRPKRPARRPSRKRTTSRRRPRRTEPPTPSLTETRTTSTRVGRLRDRVVVPAPPERPPFLGSQGPPIVTIFGAGIAGLSTAHELVERGCTVQVVEPCKDFGGEHGVEVGGLAATQIGCVRAQVARLHPNLFPAQGRDYREAVREGKILDPGLAHRLPPGEPYELDDEQRAELYTLRRIRDLPLQPTQLPVDLSDRIHFRPGWVRLEEDRREPGRDRAEPNGDKLDRIAIRLVVALAESAQLLRTEICEAESRAGRSPLLDTLHEDTIRREMLLVELRGHAVEPGRRREDDVRAIGLRRAEAVRDALVRRIRDLLTSPPDELEGVVGNLRDAVEDLFSAGGRDGAVERFIRNPEHHAVVLTVGDAEPVGSHASPKDRERSERVEVELVRTRLPGEHGYRYFPSYYRHLFDSMRRTPLLDAGGDATGQTAFDQLRTPPEVAIVLRGMSGPRTIPRSRVRSFEAIRKSLETFVEDLGIPLRDIQLFFTRVFQFMTSCEERRRECESLSWLEYVDGRTEHTVGSIRGTTAFSERAEELITSSSQALVAMDAEETDAVTHAVNMVQLMLDQLGTGAQTDMTLNGPTSDAWLVPWKAYLRHQGVRFFNGALLGFRQVEDELRPCVGLDDETEPQPEDRRHPYLGPGPDGELVCHPDDAPDFYVMALPFDRAAELVQRSEADFGGDLARLKAFDAATVARNDDGLDIVQHDPDHAELGRDEAGRPLQRWTYTMRDLVGIQFFFPNHVRIGAGHIVFQDTPWGLTSISQISHWRERASSESGFLGQVSVDIGDFYSRHLMNEDRAASPDIALILNLPDLGEPNTAWRSSIQEIAVRSWDQILDALPADYASTVELPRYFHIDRAIVTRGVEERFAWRDFEYMLVKRYPQANGTPFLIELPGQFPLRPGWSIPTREPHDGRGEPAPRIAYTVSNERWVLAGTYMATHTRLTTMESANESARHAVNAIIDAILRDGHDRYRAAGRLIGDRCEIWPLYDNEIEDLEPLRKLDAALWEEGMPHVVEILGLARFIEKLPPADRRGRPIDQLSRVLGLAAEQRRKDWGFAAPRVPTEEQIKKAVEDGTEQLLSLLDTSGTIEALRDFIDRLRGPEAPPGGRGPRG